jgi:hypothetical protein
MPIQDIDIGIAMSHFELTAREMGIAGKWRISGKAPPVSSLDYIVSWEQSD